MLGWALLGRLGSLMLTLLGVVVLVQVLLALAPGDAIDALPNADEVRPLLEAEWMLDRPVPVQIASYVGSVAQGDLRTSLVYRPGMPVVDVIAAPALRSLGLLAAATALAMLWGTALAWVVGGRRGAVAGVVRAVSIVPVFLLAHMSMQGLNGLAWNLMQRGLIDRPAWFALPLEDSALRTALAVLLLAVGSGALTDVQREVGATLHGLRSSGFVQAARGRGEATWPYLLRNMLPPLSAVLARRTAFFVGGLVVVEKLLLLNGVGSLLWQAAQQRDYPLALGIALLAGLVVGLVRLGTDAFRLLADPRLAQGQS